MRSRLVQTLVGAVAGAALAFAGLLLAPSPSAAEGTVTTTQPADASDGATPWWFSPRETSLGPTALLPQGVDFEDRQVVVRYDLRDIAPPALGRVLGPGELNPFFATPSDDPVIAPERWVLETVDGEFEGVTTSTRTRAARFDVPADFVLGTITGLRLESYRMRLPYLYQVEVPPQAGTTVQLDDGVAFTISSVLPQSSSVIFQLDIEIPHESFTAGEPQPVIIRGVGPDWDSYNQRQFEGLQLTLGTAEIPDPLQLEVRTTYWVPFETSIRVDLGGSIG